MQGCNMNKFSSIILIIILTAIALYWTRYQPVQMPNANGFFLINRFTGDIYVVSGNGKFLVEDHK